MSPTSYRLPDWLGGHAVQLLRSGTFPQNVVVNAWPEGKCVSVELNREWLVEVRPPSIDDPAEPLPLTLSSASGSGVNVWMQEADTGGNPMTVLTVGPNASMRLTARLDPDQLRQLARAAWQRANAVEAGA